MAEVSDESDVQKAAEMAEQGSPGWDVRQWLHHSSSGTLATISTKKKAEGFPMGSVVPFAVDNQGRPVILIANIAAHTRNLKADNRATLFVSDPQFVGDPQSSWRASLMGQFKQLIPSAERSADPLPEYAEEISDREWSELLARYAQRVPAAHSYMQMHGFTFWRMTDILTIRYIAGFGRICWVKGENYLEAVSEHSFADMEQGAMAHMNDDHNENMKEMCRGLYQLDPAEVSMVELGIGGFLLETQNPDGLYYFAFDSLVEKVGDYKMQIIKLLRSARSQIAQQSSETASVQQG